MDTPEEAWHLYSRFTRNHTLADDSDLSQYMVRDDNALRPSRNPGGAPRVSVADSVVKDEVEGAAGVSIGVAGR